MDEIVPCNTGAPVEPIDEVEHVEVKETGRWSEPEPIYELSAAGNADRIRHFHGHLIRWCSDARLWYYWDKCGVWKEDTRDLVVMQRVSRDMASDIRWEAEKLATDEKRKNALLQWARASESASALTRVFSIVKSEPELIVRTAQFDQDDWALNCLNGTIDLRCGELRPHRREDLITKQISLNHLPDASCPIWEQTLDSVFGGDEQLKLYFQAAIGYAATGDTRDKALFVLYGPAANNGKSTVMNTLREVLGNNHYSCQFDPTMLLSAGNSGGYKPRGDIVRLRGIRLAVGEELEGDKPVSNSLVKQLTSGSDTFLNAREVYHGSVTFKNTSKLFISSNAILRMNLEPATANRLHVIPFNTVYVGTKEEYDARKERGERVEMMDNSLQAKLKDESCGILNWIVQGSLLWQEQGLLPSESALEAKTKYIGAMDVIGTFLDDKCQEGSRVQCAVLYAAYKDWCRDTGEQPISQRALTPLLATRGITKTNKTHGRYYYEGIELAG